MTTKSEVVHCYDQLALITARMLELSQAQEWSRLPELEARCAALIKRLKDIEPDAVLDSHERDEVRRSLQRVRVDQDEVLRLVKPQLRRLLAGIAQLQQQHILEKTYGGAH